MLRSRMPSQGASRHAGSLPRSLQIPAATGCRHKALHNAHPLTPLKQARASFPLPPSRAAGSMAEATASLDVPWVVPPAPSSAPDSSTSLLVLVPGTMLGPSDYIALAAALQAGAMARVSLWVAVAAVPWQQMSSGGPDAADTDVALMMKAYEDTLAAAQAAGFPVHFKPGGQRNECVIVGMHSAGAIFAEQLSRAAGGTIFLAANLSGPLMIKGDSWPRLSEWTKPTLHLAGELDGQARATSVAQNAVEAASCVPAFGLDHVAAYKPVVLLEGLNHGDFSNGVPNLARGDLPSAAASHDDAVRRIGEAVVDFIAVHRAPPASVPRGAALSRMRDRVVDTACRLAPFTIAAGWGDIAAVYQQRQAAWPAETPNLEELLSTAPGASQPGPQLQLRHGVLPGAFGADRVSLQCAARQFMAAPGELAAAEQLCASVQKQLLRSGLPEEVVARVQIAVTAHVDIKHFTSSQPSVFAPDKRGRVLLHCHVYLYRPYLQHGPGYNLKAPNSPQYMMKLKKPEVVRLALGLETDANGSISGNGKQAAEPAISAADVNRLLMTAARSRLPPAVASRQSVQGKQLQFLPDRDVTPLISSALQWVQEEQIEFQEAGSGSGADSSSLPKPAVMEVCSPFLQTEVKEMAGGYASGGGQFVGNYYLKTLSLAWAMEWLMIDSLRTNKAFTDAVFQAARSSGGGVAAAGARAGAT